MNLKKLKTTNIVIQLIGLFSLVAGLFVMRVSFLEQFTVVSPDHNIASVEGIMMIKLIKIIFVVIGLLLLMFPLYFDKVKQKIAHFKDNKKRKDYKIIYLALILLFLLLIYMLFIFLGDYYFSSKVDLPVVPGKFNSVFNIFKTGLHFFETFILISFTGELDVNKVDLPVYELYVKEEYINKLNSDLPESGKQFVEGYIIHDNVTYKTKVRYRGDSYSHWYFKKKSWRIKLKDKQLINFSNKFNIVNPIHDSHMRILLGYFISDKFGLATPRSHHVILFLNNEYAGVYYYVDQIDESFFRMKGKLPGDIFYGDVFNGSVRLENNLFKNSSYEYLKDRWYLKGTVDNNESRAWENMEFFIKSLNMTNNTEFYQFFNQHLGEEYLRFYAFNIFIGDHHITERHNHKLYFNPSNGFFEPIVWDQIAFAEIEKIPLNSDHNSLFNRITLIPEFVHWKNKQVWEFMKILPEQDVLDYIDNTSRLIEYELYHDRYKDTLFPPWVLTNSEWRNAITALKDRSKARYEYLREKLEEANMNVSIVSGNTLVFDVGGISAVNMDISIITDYDKQKCPSIYKDKNFNFKGDDAEIMKTFCNDKGLSFESELFYPGKNAPLRYVYILENEDNAINGVSIRAYNSITGSEVSPNIHFFGSLNELPEINESASLHPWLIPVIPNKTVTLEGTKILNEDLILNKGDKLIIKPGTTINLAPGVSIISYGKVIAEGTPEMPIKFVPLDKDKPWGAVALQGDDADGSSFRYCHFEKGSGARHELVHYTGMLSAYNADIIIDHCSFDSNQIEDDTFNSKYANITITNSRFTNTFGDGIDFDISTGLIEKTEFYNIAGDAIDLMTSSPLIRDNFITQAGDKGISIGEMSNPVIANNTVIWAEIGLAIKDLSNPLIINNTLKNNSIGIAAYQKNWMYGGGGRGVVIANDFCQNNIPLLVQNASIVEIQQGDESIQCTEGECGFKCIND